MPESKKSKNKKNSSGIPIAIIIILIIIAVCIFIKVRKGNTSTQTTEENTSTTEEVVEEQPLPEYSLIDLNNTENAKVENGIKENTSSKLSEPKTYKGMTIKDIKLKAEGGITRLTATIENNTGSRYEGEEITIIFTNQDGSEYARLEGIIPAIDSGKTNEIDAATTSDIANAYDFTIAE